MSGLLDTNYIRDLFGSALSGIYGDGELIRVNMVRQPSGSVVPMQEDPVAIKVQVDVCTEAMRAQEGYSEKDVRLLILQSGVAGRQPNDDDVVVVRGDTWRIFGVTEDPAQSYWQMRGIRKATP